MENITLKDIAGYKEQKKEALKIINFLKNYKDYTNEGIDLPRGLLLTGQPGVGKTLLAKAIANESNARFVEFKNNSKETIKLIHEAFDKAKESTPSILFIDELDQIVPEKYRDPTDLQKHILQSLLTELDGLDNSKGVIVIATAARSYNLPRALLRSGRLEKQMTLAKPNEEQREEIFDLYLSKHDVLKHINGAILARKSNGLTGADIKNLTNEVLLSCKTDNTVPTIDDFEKYIPSIIYKDIKQENNAKCIDFVIAHEIGHFICNYVLLNDISAISIERYGNVAGHVRRSGLDDDMILYSNFEKEITVLFGGLAGEKVFMNDMSLGATDDIKKANEVIWQILNTGLLGFEYCYPAKENVYGENQRISEVRINKIEQKIDKIFNNSFDQAVKLVTEHKDIYDKLKDELKEEERLSVERIKQILEIKD